MGQEMNCGPSLLLGCASGERSDVLGDVGDGKMGVFDLGHKELAGAEVLMKRFC